MTEALSFARTPPTFEVKARKAMCFRNESEKAHVLSMQRRERSCAFEMKARAPARPCEGRVRHPVTRWIRSTYPGIEAPPQGAVTSAYHYLRRSRVERRARADELRRLRKSSGLLALYWRPGGGERSRHWAGGGCLPCCERNRLPGLRVRCSRDHRGHCAIGVSDHRWNPWHRSLSGRLGGLGRRIGSSLHPPRRWDGREKNRPWTCPRPVCCAIVQPLRLARPHRLAK